MIRLLAALMLLFPVGCDQRDRSLHLMRWPKGTNDGYCIKVAYGKGYALVIPDVHSMKTTERFVIGKGDSRYREAYTEHLDGGVPFTNEYWFALDKRELFPHCFTLFTTNEQEWVFWCGTNHISTNLQVVAEFMLSAQSAPSYQGESPRL